MKITGISLNKTTQQEIWLAVDEQIEKDVFEHSGVSNHPRLGIQLVESYTVIKKFILPIKKLIADINKLLSEASFDLAEEKKLEEVNRTEFIRSLANSTGLDLV